MSQVLQLFLSAPAPEKARPYYKRDVLNVCCLPSSDLISLSYKSHWLSSDVIRFAKESKLKGTDVLLIFCEERDSSNTEIYHFYPLRFAKVEDVLHSDDSFTFTIRLGAFCSYPLDMRHVIQDAIKQENPNHPDYKQIDGKVNANAKFARIANSAITIENSNDAWEELVDKIAGLRGIDDSLFFTCASLVGKPTPISVLGATWSPGAHRAQITVPKGAYREIDLYVRAGYRTAFSPIDMTVRDELASISGPFVRQFQKGYLSNYIIDFKKGWDKESSLLRIGLPPDKSNSHLKFITPEFTFYVTSSASNWMVFLVIVLLTAGSLLMSATGDFWTPLFGKLMAQADVPSPSSLALVSKTLGALLFGIGAFMGFKKLPLKS